jgi:hypothetical protein
MPEGQLYNTKNRATLPRGNKVVNRFTKKQEERDEVSSAGGGPVPRAGASSSSSEGFQKHGAQLIRVDQLERSLFLQHSNTVAHSINYFFDYNASVLIQHGFIDSLVHYFIIQQYHQEEHDTLLANQTMLHPLSRKRGGENDNDN